MPTESFSMLGELTATLADLEQICRQLAAWHERVINGLQHEGEDSRGDGATGIVTAAAELERVATALASAETALR